MNNDFIADDDQHCCSVCGRTCDCGITLMADPLPDGYVDECLACSDCDDSPRSQEAELRADVLTEGVR